MGNDQDKNEVSLTATTAAEPPAADPSNQYLGLLLKDRYLIEREIGRGGVGVVYLARDKQLLLRPVVIKILFTANADQTFTDWFQKKFRQEMEALARISHPAVVGVLDSGELPDGKPFIVMQYVEGVILRSVMTKEGMNFERVARIVRQIGQALTAAHGKGVCHRDLKPENIMLEPLGGGDEQVKLIDFGIARVHNSRMGTAAEQTWVAGTLPYMSPEQLRGRPTASSDIFSLSAVTYEMLTGQMPFKAESTVDLYDMQRKGEIVPPRQLRSGLPEAAQAAILKALSFNAEDRHSSALDFGEELARALTGEPASTDPVVAASTDPASRNTIAIRPGSKETTPDYTRVAEPVPTRSGLIIRLAVGVALVVFFALTFYRLWNNSRPGNPNGQQSSVAPGSAAPAHERSLDYWIVVQKYRDGKPYQKPFPLPGEIMFDEGDRIFLHLAVSEAGYFYLINEAPQPVKGLPNYIMLFPKPTANNGSARLAANEQLQFPERGDGIVFDNQRGIEKLWLVWSGESVPQLEAVKSVVNPTQRGEVTDPAQAKSIQDFLSKTQAESQPSIRKDEAKQRSHVAARGSVLVHQIKLLHY